MSGDKKCWCGGRVGPRSPGDAEGLGCLDSIYHDWSDTKPSGPIRRLYVSGPMTGYPECNYPAFNHAAAELEYVGYEVVNPAAQAVGSSYREIMKEDLRDLMTCDGVALLEGWWNSKGANIEVQVAGLLQMQVRPVSEWIDMVIFGDADRPCAGCGDQTAIKGFLLCNHCLAVRAAESD